jgi:hypothetical protein
MQTMTIVSVPVPVTVICVPEVLSILKGFAAVKFEPVH